ncbi:unannotated protein [freshwater metagenome]|uniref:Unannotated protein n=1 Tax=freshwater metagenome TaxID=449393 RepID=A0A6J6QP16_9ZZZZ
MMMLGSVTSSRTVCALTIARAMTISLGVMDSYIAASSSTLLTMTRAEIPAASSRRLREGEADARIIDGIYDFFGKG